jgi:hypothetical protein
MNIKILSTALVVFCVIELFPQKVGDAYALNINNIYLPINDKGILADVNIPPIGPWGQFGGHTFLFSGGFFLSGFSNGQLWANAVASASLVEDYLPGTFGNPNNPDAQLYKLRSDDPPFGQSWQDWIDAVELGADFYDGDNDGIYNPVDLNSNGQWDSTEDRPDLLGDETLWCVYHDGVPSVQRRWNTVEPQGIEIRQTVFAYSTVDELQNIIFIRYRIKNTGVVANEMTDVYFGIWDDPDLGDYTDDLVGSDTLLQSGYTYNDGADSLYGNNPPAFFQSFLQGPRVYIPGETFIDNNGNGNYDEGIDTPLDTAFVYRGQEIGVTIYPGAKNQTFSSSIEYINGDPNLQDPNTADEARNYMLGLNRIGELPDPCNWTYGQVRGGVNCSEVNPFFWYSGDPVTNYGWISTYPRDKRQMQNIGPFTLNAGEEYEVFVAYSVGQGTNALSSITEGRVIAEISSVLYHCNFLTNCVVSVEENSITQPDEFILDQNYPNPFNPSTKISWQSPVGSWQTIKIYDVLGNEVATLVDEYRFAGTYEVEFNASTLPSSVYFYQLRTRGPEINSGQGIVETKKMILLK